MNNEYNEYNRSSKNSFDSMTSTIELKPNMAIKTADRKTWNNLSHVAKRFCHFVAAVVVCLFVRQIHMKVQGHCGVGGHVGFKILKKRMKPCDQFTQTHLGLVLRIRLG